MTSTIKTWENNVAWDSGLKTTKACIYVENRVNDILASIQKKVGNDEYSVLFKGYWDEDGFVVSNEYRIPKQKVSGASVDYEENIGELRVNDGWNVVAHSHPFSRGKGSYSGADDSHINTHFPCSLLTDGDGDIVNATLKLDTPNKDYRILLEIDSDDIKTCSANTEEIVGLDNIVKKTYDYQTSRINNHNQRQLQLTQGIDWDNLGEPEWKKERDRYMKEKNMVKDSNTGVWRRKTIDELEDDEIEKDIVTYHETCSGNIPF
jgi:hypothetical protein|tara:strand:+ start:3752 stop:4540 length:789 start_codon:yes stop_codon:yes gene_type:complete